MRDLIMRGPIGPCFPSRGRPEDGRTCHDSRPLHQSELQDRLLAPHFRAEQQRHDERDRAAERGDQHRDDEAVRLARSTNRLKNALRTGETINAPDWVSDLALPSHW